MTTTPPLRLQVIVTEETRFLTIADPATPITGLKQNIEKEYGELYPAEEPITILRLQDSFHNDMPTRFNIGELLKDMDKIYTVLKPAIAPGNIPFLYQSISNPLFLKTQEQY